MSADAGIIAALLFFMGGKKTGKDGRSSEPVASVGASLMARATSERARSWIPTFLDLDQTQSQALAWSRWAGIETGGDPLAVSPLGERGLFQCMPSTQPGTMTTSDWAAVQRPSTTRKEHARIALALAGVMWARARRNIKNPPDDPASKIWYGKLWHSRPADFNRGVMHGDALNMARQLAVEWQGKPKQTYRLLVSNVIAFGTPNP